MGHGKSVSLAVYRLSHQPSLFESEEIFPHSQLSDKLVFLAYFKQTQTEHLFQKGWFLGWLAGTTVLMFWGPYFSFMTSSQQCSVEMRFVEHESIRRRAGRAGSLRGGRRGRVHRGTTGYLRGLWRLVVLFKMHLGELRNNELLIGARNHFCWDHKLKGKKQHTSTACTAVFMSSDFIYVDIFKRKRLKWRRLKIFSCFGSRLSYQISSQTKAERLSLFKVSFVVSVDSSLETGLSELSFFKCNNYTQ